MQRLSESQKSFLREATERYRRSLNGSPAEEYLATRGLMFDSVKDEVDRFMLGYVDDPLPGHEMFRGFMAIPYLRWSREHGWIVVAIRYRCIQDHDHRGHGKYMTAPGDQPWLYNTLALLREVPDVAITEGEIDAITAQVCGLPAVGVPGANMWKPYMRELFIGYRTVYVLADGDEPGAEFANRVALTLPNSRVIPMPPGEDVNSLVISKGKSALLERMS
ncbi:DNA primase [Mycobacterium phage Iceman]|uniref:DNA primase n=3 Tax=Backyardiganvirus peaches TaxID=663557 RepID=A0A1J0GRB1_9CAUD|nr:DNA primase [Mycobacterium phage MeeZee]APC44234.1 DNA primase [Mycobacterium phage Albee]AWN06069.1 DNA primase [Mycobacterium phage Relief]UVK58809.1 DNA primase [Mycobacterium phage Iceman]